MQDRRVIAFGVVTMMGSELAQIRDKCLSKPRMWIGIKLWIAKVRDLRLVSTQFHHGRTLHFTEQRPRAAFVDAQKNWQLTATRYAELAAMQEFIAHRSCLMEFVARALDDEHARACGRCATCRETLVSTDVDPELVRQATAFLRRSHIVIEPRKQWPGDAVAGRAGRIRQKDQAAQGYA